MTQLLGETGRKKMLKYDVLHNKLSSFNTLFILALYFVFVHKIIFGVTRYRSQYMVKMDPGGGGALGYFLRGYVPPGTPNWHPVLRKISPKIDTPFYNSS